jgi:type III secretion system protein
MLHNYRKLLQLSTQRVAIGNSRLVQVSRNLDIENGKLTKLKNAISLQQQLGQVGEFTGDTLNRQQLFDLLRKMAVTQQRTQLLKIELHRQEERSKECGLQVAEHQEICRKLEKRRERYRLLHEKECAWLRLRQLNNEEIEIEEYVSWSM